MPQGPRPQHGCTASATLQARLDGQALRTWAYWCWTLRDRHFRGTELPAMGEAGLPPCLRGPVRRGPFHPNAARYRSKRAGSGRMGMRPQPRLA